MYMICVCERQGVEQEYIQVQRQLACALLSVYALSHLKDRRVNLGVNKTLVNILFLFCTVSLFTYIHMHTGISSHT